MRHYYAIVYDSALYGEEIKYKFAFKSNAIEKLKVVAREHPEQWRIVRCVDAVSNLNLEKLKSLQCTGLKKFLNIDPIS